jgi:hypothetical protein
MMRDWTPADLRQLRLLRSPPGSPGAARARYGAAMHFYETGRLTARALEVYRICASRDGDDPAVLMRARGIADRLPPAPRLGPELAVAEMIEEADLYLSGLSGPGISESRALLARARSGKVTAVRRRNGVVRDHLAPALDALSAQHPALALAIRRAAPHLPWTTYRYADAAIGPHFPTSHAFCSLVGPKGAAIHAVDFEFGLFLVAPHILYRDHTHAAPELYAPLTGPHGWRFAPGASLVLKPAHVPVWNAPHAAHLIKVGPVPFLCLYAWTADVDRPARVVPAHDWDRLEALRLEATA